MLKMMEERVRKVWTLDQTKEDQILKCTAGVFQPVLRVWSQMYPGLAGLCYDSFLLVETSTIPGPLIRGNVPLRTRIPITTWDIIN